MNQKSPPRWLEQLLLHLLEPRHRETISGDLLEEYREEKLPKRGALRANYWYLRQLISFGSIQFWKGALVKQILIVLCFFTVAAGIWLGIMENVLKHEGYAGRSIIAACIAAQSFATLLLLLFRGGAIFRLIIVCGAVAVAFVGASAVIKDLRAEHFEGFVLIIGAALIIQAALTLATFFQKIRLSPSPNPSH